MSKFLLHVDLTRRTLITRDGGTFTMPSLTLGDAATFALRAYDRDSNSALVEQKLNLRTLRASIGKVLSTPSGGTFALRLDPTHESTAIPFDATTDAIRSAVTALPESTPLLEVLPSAETGCWLLRFNHSGPVPLEGASNRLLPRSFVRVRAFEDNGRWWHEVRLIQSPLAFSGSLLSEDEALRLRFNSRRFALSVYQQRLRKVSQPIRPAQFHGTAGFPGVARRHGPSAKGWGKADPKMRRTCGLAPDGQGKPARGAARLGRRTGIRSPRVFR